MPEVLKIMKMIGKVDPLKSVGSTWEIAVNKYLFLVGPVPQRSINYSWYINIPLKAKQRLHFDHFLFL